MKTPKEIHVDSLSRPGSAVQAGPALHRGADQDGVAREVRGGSVLLVDDELLVRMVTSHMLERLGFAVLAAKDGVEAVEMFQQHADDIQCVLCDLTMPRMDGWETLTALRHIAPGIPVILVSGCSEAQVIDGAHLERTQAYLRKPYLMAALKDALARAMEGELYPAFGQDDGARRRMMEGQHDQQG